MPLIERTIAGVSQYEATITCLVATMLALDIRVFQSVVHTSNIAERNAGAIERLS